MKSLLSFTIAAAMALPAAWVCADTDAALPTRHLHVGGGRIAFDDSGGEGRLVLAIPSMGDLRGEYRYLRGYLLAQGYRVVTMDVRGHGESSVEWPDYSARAVGSDAIALLEHLDAGSVVLIGTSFAAGAALWAADESPHIVSGAVLIGPVVRDLPRSLLTNVGIAVGFGGPWRVWFWTAYWDSLFPARKPADHEEYRAMLAANLREPGRMKALRTMIGLSKAETDALIDRSEVPSLIVMGSRDRDFADPTEEARALAARLKAETVIVSGAGHYPHVEMPEGVALATLRFIQTL